MALTLLVNGLSIDVYGHRAQGRFDYTSTGDLPARGAAAGWVDGSGDWVVADVVIEPRWYGSSTNHMARIVARRPGFDWTWLGLEPITEEGSYELSWSYDTRYDLWDTSTTPDTHGVRVAHLRPQFSSWGNSHDLIVSDSAVVKVDSGGSPGASASNGTLSGVVLNDGLPTWKVEWLDNTRRATWLDKRNGAWPTGFVPPVTGTGAYFCQELRIDAEQHIDPNGNKVTYYRHHAEFAQAPRVDGVQHVWRATQW